MGLVLKLGNFVVSIFLFGCVVLRNNVDIFLVIIKYVFVLIKNLDLL